MSNRHASNLTNLLVALAGLVFLPWSAVASAAIVWEWSFAGEAGTFTTDGTAIGGAAVPGAYTFQDFRLTSSASGGALGSVSGGQYITEIDDTHQPFVMVWDGSSVTVWQDYIFCCNAFDWWTFAPANITAPGEMYPKEAYFFGFARDLGIGEWNDPTRAAHWFQDDPEFDLAAKGLVTVRVATPIPLVGGLWLLMPGAIGLLSVRRRIQ